MRFVATCVFSSILGGLFVLWLADPGLRHTAMAQQEPVLQPPAPLPGPQLPSFDAVPRTPSSARPAELIFNADGLSPDEAISVAVYDRNNKGVVNITTKSVNTILLLDVSSEGSGSGSVIDREGHILTNFHVIEDAQEVGVTLFDGKTYDAKLVGADPNNDIAVIKIDAPREVLFPIQVGDSADLRVGMRVFAIGNPFGLERTMTTGIVSSLNRSLQVRGTRSIKSIIQIDAAVNPGNSGGPLFNLKGEVVGINSMIFSRTGGYMGLSFAIPIDVAIGVRDQLVKNGRVVRGRIGVAVQDIDASLAQAFGLDRPHGALVSAVEDEGPAKQAGMRPGDVITAVGDREIDRFSDVASVIASLQPGTEVPVRVWREGKERSLSVRVVELQDETATLARKTRDAQASTQLGMAVRPLTDNEKRAAETDGSLVVEQVSGAAANAGVQPGDIVLGVNGKTVKSVDELRGAVKQSGRNVAVLIERGEAQIFVPIRVG